jgi:protein-tyrosine phosphatase
MLRSFDPRLADKDLLDQGIEDPWYGGQADFETVWHEVHAALPGLVDYIMGAVLRNAQLQRQA